MFYKKPLFQFKCHFTILVLVVFLLIGVFQPLGIGHAQGGDSEWTDFENISKTATASSYPSVVADLSGNIHVFWSEDVGGRTENVILDAKGAPQLDSFGRPINWLYDSGNSLFYTRWDGKRWLSPIDIQYNKDGLIDYPRAVVDPQGMLHVIWYSSIGMDTKLMYSHAPVEMADSVRNWSKPIVLAERILFAYYPIGIATDPSGGLHVLYSQLGSDPGAYIINSVDGGATWSEPVLLYSTNDSNGFLEGVSNIRLIGDSRGWLHATWTYYDSSGNGKKIFYTQSRDSGLTWSQPFEVAAWQPGWYEVDWLSAVILGDEVHLVWEGSSEIASQVERISHDGGLTWGEPHFILPNLRGENGFANLVVDSAGHLYLLIVKRGDPATLSNGIWYSKWDQGQWREPILLGTHITNLYNIVGQIKRETLASLLRNTFTGDGFRYPESVIVNGNELFVIIVNEWDGEIWSSHTKLDAPYISPHSYKYPIVTPTLNPTTPSQTVLDPTPVLNNRFSNNVPVQPASLTNILFLGALPTLIIILGFLVFIYLYKAKGQ